MILASSQRRIFVPANGKRNFVPETETSFWKTPVENARVHTLPSRHGIRTG
jgi:hypothetical protein